MADATYAMTNFQGGELSPAYQGRVDDDDYKKSLALCLNYIPNQEGSLLPRSGFKRIGNTRANAPARLLPFRFSAYEPYVSEFTGFGPGQGYLRLWANGLAVLTSEAAGIKSVSGAPPTFVIQDTRFGGTGLVPAEWATGDRIMVNIGDATLVQTAGYLCNREFILNIVSASAGTVTLTDAVTGVPLAAAVTGVVSTGVSYMGFYKILEIDTKYQYPAGVRQVQITEQTITGVNGSSAIKASPPDRRVTYLYPLIAPYSLSAELTVQYGLVAENFIDGPYLDSFGTDIPMAIVGTTGDITVTIHGYDANIIYMAGDCVVSYATAAPRYYVSLTDNNKGNALTEVGPFINANWASVAVNEKVWNSGTTFVIGNATAYLPNDVDGVPTVYYSKQNANTNKKPTTQPLWWGTTPPAWDILVQYAANAYVTDVGVTYLSIAVPTLGTAPAAEPAKWVIAPDVDAAVDLIANTKTGWLSAPLFYIEDAGGDDSGSMHLGNPARLIRLKAGPQPWSNKITYALNDLVNAGDIIYKSLAGSNIANDPTTDATKWEIQTTTIKWTWGKITYAGDHMLQATVHIMGEDLPDSHPVWEFRFGVYSDTTGWPRCGAYHEGRLWLSGSSPNRLDGGYSNQGYNFAPTAPDGTVSDANAIALTINCEENETVETMSSITDGLSVFTSASEWIISASSLNDPLTPTSVQARRTTAWSAFPNETTRLPNGLLAIQKGGRRVLEYRTFVDMTSYQSRLNVVDLTRKCQHLTYGGVGVTQYQSMQQPIIWCAPSPWLLAYYPPLTHDICALGADDPTVSNKTQTSTLFGIGHSRAPDVNYSAPFSFEHGRTLSTGFQQVIDSIAIQRGELDTAEYLYAVSTGSNGKSYVEMMMPLMESTPLADAYDGSGIVTSFGTLSSAFMLDSALTPAGAKIATDGLSVTFYGLQTMAGQTVSFTIRGKYVGDYLIAANGSVNIPFSTGTDTSFLISDVGRAIRGNFNSNVLPPDANGTSQRFQLDANGYSVQACVGFADGTNFLGQFGYKYRRRGKMLRPIVGSQNGPTFAKTVRNDAAGIYLDAAQEVSAGGDFSTLVPVEMTLNGTRDTTALTASDFVTGIFRVNIDDTYDFNGQICWEQTRPVPGAVLGVGGFFAVMDK